MSDLRDAMFYGTHCARCGAYIGEAMGFTMHCSRECATARDERFDPREAIGAKFTLWHAHKRHSQRKQRL